MMEKVIYRQWCKHCLDWKLFNMISLDKSIYLIEKANIDIMDVFNSNRGNCLICSRCDNIATTYTLEEIPREKIFEQQIRYKNNRIELLNKIGNVYNTIDSIFSDVDSNIKIIEADAGLESIERKKHNKADERHKIYIEERNTLKGIYGGSRRNDKCPCGSGKKFKHCHLIECTQHGVNHK